MKFSKGTSTTLLVMGLITLFFWITRSVTWYTNDLRQMPGYLPYVHLPMIVISLVIGFYLTYVGIKGRRAASRS